MKQYYDTRAPEYDEWYLGLGRFAELDRPGWEQDLLALERTVAGLAPATTLDVACGTGFLTRHLRGEVTALDQSRAMVDIARARLPAAAVVRGEAVPLPFADHEFSCLFTGHFYGHLLPDERRAFLGEARRVATELVVVDSALRDGVDREVWQERRLSDGSGHRVYKRYFDARSLADELGGAEILYAGRWFVAVAARSLESAPDL
jgi:ubiquinone/menaquinone biosynthesis C-methylase UbiE